MVVALLAIIINMKIETCVKPEAVHLSGLVSEIIVAHEREENWNRARRVCVCVCVWRYI